MEKFLFQKKKSAKVEEPDRTELDFNKSIDTEKDTEKNKGISENPE